MMIRRRSRRKVRVHSQAFRVMYIFVYLQSIKSKVVKGCVKPITSVASPATHSMPLASK